MQQYKTCRNVYHLSNYYSVTRLLFNEQTNYNSIPFLNLFNKINRLCQRGEIKNTLKTLYKLVNAKGDFYTHYILTEYFLFITSELKNSES